MTRQHSASAYRDVKFRCRCAVCREANTARKRLEREAMAARLVADPTLVEHGSAATYTNWHCRCEPCTKANTAKCAEYKGRRKARAGVAR